MKVLVELFQKLAPLQGAEPWSRVATRETSSWHFSFVSFSLCAFCVKEKSD
jgi:hypothetical protein